MRNPVKVFLYSVLTLFSASCSDSQELQPIDKLGARLVAYDEDGVERTLFEANTDITFGLNVTNKSNDNIEAGGLYQYCNVYEDAEFLLIYQLIGDDNGGEKWIPLGKPYRTPLPCLMVNMPLIVPAKGEAKLHGAPWSLNPDNAPFTPGHYYTAFSLHWS